MDLGRPERRPGRDELVAGGEHDDVRPAVHLDRRVPAGGEHRDRARPDDLAGRHDDGAGGDVLAARAHVAATPGHRAALDLTLAAPSVSSTAMTASAPWGILAPVMMRAASPGPTRKLGSSPAATSPTMRSRTGCAPAPASESDTTAYPSIDELSKPGRLTLARTSRATTSPRLSVSGIGAVGAGSSDERIARRCSSTVRTSAGARRVAGSGCVGSPSTAWSRTRR